MERLSVQINRNVAGDTNDAFIFSDSRILKIDMSSVINTLAGTGRLGILETQAGDSC